MKLSRIEPLVLNVSQKTNWLFIRVTTDDGRTGLGEASLNGWEPAHLAHAAMVAQELAGLDIAAALQRVTVYPHSPGGLIASSIASAIEQAIVDVQAQQAGLPVCAFLGTPRRRAVRMYANINRGARDRTPAGIARSAQDAVARGYTALKIAPFDGVLPDRPAAANRKLIDEGIARIYAMREAVGSAVDLMVDCHWRFDERGAIELARELAAARLYWLECPVSENPDGYAALARVRDAVHDHGMKFAGAERQIGVAGFRPYIEQRLLDVVMPDVKYAGGYRQMLAIAALCEQHGVAFSPHNPTGPICNLASLHLSAVAPAFAILEHQLAESPLYADVVHGYSLEPVDGCFTVPTTPGLGVTLDERILAAHPYRPLAPNANLDPRLG